MHSELPIHCIDKRKAECDSPLQMRIGKYSVIPINIINNKSSIKWEGILLKNKEMTTAIKPRKEIE